MNVLMTVFSLMLAMLGILFLIGYQGQTGRLIIGLVLIGAGILLFAAARLRPRQTTVVQKIDFSGDVAARDLKCKNCGGTLTDKSVTIKAGAVFIHCEFCGSEYQLEEEPKW